MMLLRFIEFVIFEVAWKVIEYMWNIIVTSAYSAISNIVYILGAILLATLMLYRYKTIQNRVFAFSFTGKALSVFNMNNPDIFPHLNETALKKHIRKKITNTPFAEIISRISLYESNVPGFKYQLIVEAPEHHKGFSNISTNWEKECPLEDDFSDIYREKPKDNYKTEWSCSVTDLDPQLQDSMVVKTAKWLLYRK